MITFGKIQDVVLMGKARAVELSKVMIDAAYDGSHRFQAKKYELMYLMSYIQTLENYDLESELVEEEKIIETIEKIDILCLQA